MLYVRKLLGCVVVKKNNEQWTLVFVLVFVYLAHMGTLYNKYKLTTLVNSSDIMTIFAEFNIG